MPTILFVFSGTIIFAVAIYLAACQKYDDGVVGHVALALMAAAGGLPIWEIINGVDYVVQPTTLLLYVAVALFMLRHALRFIRWRSTGRNDWRSNDG